MKGDEHDRCDSYEGSKKHTLKHDGRNYGSNMSGSNPSLAGGGTSAKVRAQQTQYLTKPAPYKHLKFHSQFPGMVKQKNPGFGP